MSSNNNNNNTSHSGTALNSNTSKSRSSKSGFRYGSVNSANTSTDPENYEDALLLCDESTASGHRDGEYTSNGHHFYSGSLRSLSQRASSIRVSMSRSLREFVEVGFVPDGSISVSVRTFEGGATVSSEIANIAKNLIGAGVLSMSGGIALFADDPRAVWYASFWICVFGAMLGYYCLLIGKICRLTGAATYGECWQRTLGDRGALIVSCCIAFNPAMGDLAYAAILSQTFQSLLETIGLHVTRIQSLLFITVVAILPLCLLKNLYVLAPFSILGTFGVIMTAAAMVIRYLDGSYQPGGIYFDDISVEHQPKFGHYMAPFSFNALPFICMLFQAYVMHYNSARFYTELCNPTIPRFTAAVGGSFGLSAFLYIIIAAAGFMTFGGNSDSYVLNNYSAFDPLATLCRLAIAFSTLTTFPIVFIGFRDGVLDIFQISAERQTSNFINVLTLILLSMITLVACFATDLGVINAITGGIIATANVFVFPSLMFYYATKNAENRLETKSDTKRWMSYQMEAYISFFLMAIGVTLGIVGTYISLQ